MTFLIKDYIDKQPVVAKPHLEKIYQLIKSVIPEAEEKMSYQMPTFYLHGNVVHFAAQKAHLGFYPAPSGVHYVESKLTDFVHAKGSIQFPYDQPLPEALILEILTFRKAEQLNKKKPTK